MRLFRRLARGSWRVTLTACVAALVLAGCASTPIPATTIAGTPALSISVPLDYVGCTLNDACVAIGYSSGTPGAAVGEFSSTKGHWFDLALPPVASPLLSAVACSGSACLVGGSSPGNNLLWRYSASDHTMSMATPPKGGNGVSALSCDAIDCAMIDTLTSGVARLSLSGDAGMTWTTPLPLTSVAGEAITSLSCGSVFHCVVSAVTPRHHVDIYVTNDAGETWSMINAPGSWSSLSSITCEGRHCVGLAQAGTSSLVVRSDDFFATWSELTLTQHANDLSCTTVTKCVIVGQKTNSAPWLATLNASAIHDVALRYVPSPLLGVACGSKVCAAIGVTTLVSMPLTFQRGA